MNDGLQPSEHQKSDMARNEIPAQTSLGWIVGEASPPTHTVAERQCIKIEDTSDEWMSTDRPNIMCEYVHSSELICEENEPIQCA